MKRNLRYFLCLTIGMLSLFPTTKAQFVNFEDTWKEFLRNSKTSNISKLVKPSKDDTVDYAKYCLMNANTDFCSGKIRAAEDLMYEIKKIGEDGYKVIPGFKPRFDDLSLKIEAYHKVERLWRRFLNSRDVSLSELDKAAIAKKVCEKGTLAKYFYMVAYAHYCKGEIAKARDNFENRVLKLAERTSLKIKDIVGLESEVKMMKTLFKSLRKLDIAWKKYIETDVSPGFEAELPLVKCYPIPSMKAYVLQATVDLCENGPEMLKKIKDLQDSNTFPIEADLGEKLKWLDNEVGDYNGDLDTLNKAWKEFVVNDTLTSGILYDFEYCQKMAQIKAWTIGGHMDPCNRGQENLDKIDSLQKSFNLTFDDELSCRVLRLRGKVYQCRYWELVLQARKETHAERERFGPVSAEIMRKDLNSDKQPCETKVQYFPLGNIGIKYVISTFLCQDVDLAKMGDPEYYKKIATWVDTQVLQKYCEEGLRCKEDFFIYLEGHADGNAFIGVSYRNSLEIPEGTSFTHFVDGDTLQTTTERKITTSLKSNMELGIARAWTVKHQLDFMEVPITIGAFEHPKEEKGGEYRRVEIELNITNLLLDFYEKRLNELIEESGIGERPEGC